MQYILKPRDRVFDTDVQFPDIPEEKSVAIAFSGGMESTLIAHFAIQKYGVDRVYFVMFDNIFSRDVAIQTEVVANNVERAIYALNGKFENFRRYTFDSNLHATERVRSLKIVEQTLRDDLPHVENIYFGFTNVFFDVEPLNSVSGYTVPDIRSIIESDRVKYERVIDEFHTDYNDKFLKLLLTMNIQPGTYDFLRTTPNVMMPFSNLDKGEIVDLYYQAQLEDLLYETWSCTTFTVLGSDKHCGECFNCQQRYDGHVHTNREDLTQYVNTVVKDIWNRRAAS